MRYKYGQLIELDWDGSAPDAFFIMGHVRYELGIYILGSAGILEKYGRRIGQAEHKYGRWSMEPTENGCGHVLRDYKEAGRGRFKVTMFGVGIFALKENNK